MSNAQPAKMPCDTAIELKQCASSWDRNARLLGNVKAESIVELCDEYHRLKFIANYISGSPSPIPWDKLQQMFIDDIEKLQAKLAELKYDQGQWRKGVELIASAAAHDTSIALCCVSIAETVLGLRAEAESVTTLTAEVARLKEENELLRDFVKAKDEYIACYKLSKRPTEKLFKNLATLAAALADTEQQEGGE